MKRILPLILVLTLAACGDTEDPSTNNGNTTNNNQPDQGNNNNQPDMNVTPDQGTDMTTPTDLGTDMDMNVVPDQGTDMNNGMACGVNENFKGQIAGNKPNDGGTYATDNSSYADDAGLDAVWTLLNKYQTEKKFPDNDPATMDVNECNTEVAVPEAEQVQVTGARVTGVFYSRTSGARVIVQDKKRALLMFLPPAVAPDGANADSTSINVGQTIDFKVTGLKRFACSTPQVSNISGFNKTADNQPVYVQELTGQDLTIDKYMQTVKIGGKLTGFSMCGGSAKCFALEHGPEGAKKTIVYRSNSDFLDMMDEGKCVTFVGPVAAFPDVFAATAENPAIPQLNVDNFNWSSYID